MANLIVRGYGCTNNLTDLFLRMTFRKVWGLLHPDRGESWPLASHGARDSVPPQAMTWGLVDDKEGLGLIAAHVPMFTPVQVLRRPLVC